MKKEIGKRIATAMVTMKNLDEFWLHSNWGVKLKIEVADAVLSSKVLYGIETAQLNEPELKRLDVFQRKALRQILRMEATCIDKRNTN